MTRTAFVVAMSLLAPALNAGTIATSFEFSRGDFTLGEAPEVITFTGGRARSIGVLSLYHSGSFAWMIDPGQTGTITFETPAQELSFFIRDQFPAQTARFKCLTVTATCSSRGTQLMALD